MLALTCRGPVSDVAVNGDVAAGFEDALTSALDTRRSTAGSLYLRANFERVPYRALDATYDGSTPWWSHRSYVGYRSDGTPFTRLDFSYTAPSGWRLHAEVRCR